MIRAHKIPARIAILRGAVAVLLAWPVALLSPAARADHENWALDMIGATLAQQAALNNGFGVRVGVLDSFANYTHPEFGGRLDKTWGVVGGSYNFFDNHGTHVSGIIGAGRDFLGMRGVALGVNISNYAVFDDNGWAGISVGQALRRVRQDGATVANMSFGPVPTRAGGQTLLAFKRTMTAIKSLRNAMVVTLAAGNGDIYNIGRTLKHTKIRGLNNTSLKNLIIVGSVDRNKRLSSFSNRPGQGCFMTRFRGKWRCRARDKYMKRFLVAPGRDILSTGANGGYITLSGTSMAAPHVAGAAALLQSKWPFLKSNPKRTANILLTTAEDLGKKGVDPRYGRGLLRVDRAANAVGQTQLIVGSSVNGPGYSGSALQLSPAFGTGKNVVKALEGVVVFDKFQRDFKLADPGSFVLTSANTFSPAQHFQNRFEMADRGNLASFHMTDQLSFTGVVPTRAVDQAGTVNVMQQAAQKSSLAQYQDYMQDEQDVWRLEGKFETMSFSFGQRLGMARDIALGGPTELFLFDSELSLQPLTSLGEQTLFGFGSYKVSDAFGLGMGFAETSLQPGATLGTGSGHAVFLQADYAATQKLGLQLTQTFLTESDSALGSPSVGAFAFGSSATTLATGAALSFELSPFTTAKLHITESFTETEPASLSLFREMDRIESRSYGLSLTRKGVFGRENDEVGISISRPFRVSAGEAVLDVPVGRTIGGKIKYNTAVVSLAPEGSQTDFDFAYRASLASNLSFGVNLFYQDEANHDPDEWNAGLLSRVRLTF